MFWSSAASNDQELSEAADVTDKIDCVYEEDTEECTLVSSIYAFL